jgi:flavodoxin
MRIPVGYGSVHGPTAEVARRIGAVLEGEDFPVDVVPLGRAEGPER